MCPNGEDLESRCPCSLSPSSAWQSHSRASQEHLPRLEQSSCSHCSSRRRALSRGEKIFSLSSHQSAVALPGEVISPWLKNTRSGQDMFPWEQQSLSLTWETMRISLTLHCIVNTCILFFHLTTSAAVSLCPTCLQLFWSKRMSFTFFFNFQTS